MAHCVKKPMCAHNRGDEAPPPPEGMKKRRKGEGTSDWSIPPNKDLQITYERCHYMNMNRPSTEKNTQPHLAVREKKKASSMMKKGPQCTTNVLCMIRGFVGNKAFRGKRGEKRNQMR